MERRRVVVTGLGVVTSIGLDETAFWDSLTAGRSGVIHHTRSGGLAFRTKVAAEVDSQKLAEALSRCKIAASDRTCQMAQLASEQALRDAGLLAAPPPYAPQDIATVFGTGAGCSASVSDAYANYFAKGLRGVRPTTVPRCMANSVSSGVSMHFRLTGTNYVTVAACTSSTNAMGIAFRMVRDGYSDCVLCGGADTTLDTLNFAGWDSLGVMSRNPDPAAACRPFDVRRDGCVLGEGAGALVIESIESARRRGARVRAEFCGYGESSDAEHITRPSVEGQSRAMVAALSDAGVLPGQVGFINAHGTATEANDTCESQSIRRTFGEHADSIPVASNKSYFGHLLGASGIVEAAATVLTLEHQLIPANLNLETPDPECQLRFVGASPEPLLRPVAVKNSFGFGGSNAVLVLRRACE
jgi:3-oxoacyl-[acyl-carrier-protein] synthase II